MPSWFCDLLSVSCYVSSLQRLLVMMDYMASALSVHCLLTVHPWWDFASYCDLLYRNLAGLSSHNIHLAVLFVLHDPQFACIH